MNTSTFWKGLALVAVVFLFTGLEAAAQLPVRTQRLQLINPLGGTLTHDVTTGVIGADYTVTWPGTSDHSGGAPAASDEAILIGTWDGANTWDLRWEESDGFVDGEGLINHVAWWNPDNNTLDHSDNFEWNGTILGVGVDNEGTVGGQPAASIIVGDGTNTEISLAGATGIGTFGATGQAGIVNVANSGANEIVLDAGSATATVGATTSGTVEVTNAGTNSIVLDGANATATIGTNNAQAGTLEIEDANGQTLTVVTGDQTSDWTLQPNDHTAGDATYYVAPNTNAIATDGSMDNYLLIANANGTATWETNPFAGLERGVADPTDGAYSYDINLASTVTPDANDVIIVTSLDISGTPVGNILAVTAYDADGTPGAAPFSFQVDASGPFTSTERIAWIFIPVP